MGECEPAATPEPKNPNDIRLNNQNRRIVGLTHRLINCLVNYSTSRRKRDQIKPHFRGRQKSCTIPFLRIIRQHRRFLWYTCIYGGDLASTWVAKPEVHAENENSRKTDSTKHKCKQWYVWWGCSSCVSRNGKLIVRCPKTSVPLTELACRYRINGQLRRASNLICLESSREI